MDEDELLGWKSGGSKRICRPNLPHVSSASSAKPAKTNAYLGRAKRVVSGKLELRMEHSSFERRVLCRK